MYLHEHANKHRERLLRRNRAMPLHALYTIALTLSLHRCASVWGGGRDGRGAGGSGSGRVAWVSAGVRAGREARRDDDWWLEFGIEGTAGCGERWGVRNGRGRKVVDEREKREKKQQRQVLVYT